jgi:hypothetical protein
MPGGGMGSGTSGSGTGDPSRSVVVVVPFTQKFGTRPFYKKGAGGHRWDLGLTHPLGSTNLLVDNTSIEIYPDFVRRPGETQTVPSSIRFKHQSWSRSNDAQVLFDLINEALENGMVADAVQWSDELLTVVDEKKVKTSPPVDRFATAYRKVQKPLREPPGQPSDAAEWKARLDPSGNETQVQTRGHYSLLFWDSGKAEVDRRFAQLDDNFKAFFLWHATRGVALTVPTKPLVAVLPKSGQEVRRIAYAIDGAFTGADAFYAPAYDLLVLSPERLDGIGVTFQKQSQQVYQGVGRQTLINGEGPVLTPTVPGVPAAPNSKKPEEVARMQTWAMVDRYLEEEAEISGVSREATRQLYYATGLMPRHVVLPEWLSNGSVSFFHRPKGPVFTRKDDKKYYMTVALTTGYGVPNYVMHKHWINLSDRKELNPDPAALLRNVVTDAYFDAARDASGNDIDPPPPVKPVVLPPGVPPPPPENPYVLQRRKRDMIYYKAHASAWALYYYLARNNPAGLERYFSELNRLPRDLPLDAGTRLASFARAFELADPKTGAIDADKFANFARGWVGSMQNVPAVGVEVKLNDPPPATSGSGTGPGSGGSLGPPPGGSMGPGPGGM